MDLRDLVEVVERRCGGVDRHPRATQSTEDLPVPPGGGEPGKTVGDADHALVRVVGVGMDCGVVVECDGGGEPGTRRVRGPEDPALGEGGLGVVHGLEVELDKLIDPLQVGLRGEVADADGGVRFSFHGAGHSSMVPKVDGSGEYLEYMFY